MMKFPEKNLKKKNLMMREDNKSIKEKENQQVTTNLRHLFRNYFLNVI